MTRTVTRAELLAECRSWIGTPVIWQQCRKHRGVDCKFLMVGVAIALGLDEARSWASVVRDYDFAFSPKRLVTGLDDTLIRTTLPGPGDVVAMLMGLRRDGPRHLAMLSDRPGWIIHAYGKGIDTVCEVPLGGERKVCGYWTWPSLAPEERLG